MKLDTSDQSLGVQAIDYSNGNQFELKLHEINESAQVDIVHTITGTGVASADILAGAPNQILRELAFSADNDRRQAMNGWGWDAHNLFAHGQRSKSVSVAGTTVATLKQSITIDQIMRRSRFGFDYAFNPANYGQSGIKKALLEMRWNEPAIGTIIFASAKPTTLTSVTGTVEVTTHGLIPGRLPNGQIDPTSDLVALARADIRKQQYAKLRHMFSQGAIELPAGTTYAEYIFDSAVRVRGMVVLALTGATVGRMVPDSTLVKDISLEYLSGTPKKGLSFTYLQEANVREMRLNETPAGLFYLDFARLGIRTQFVSTVNVATQTKLKMNLTASANPGRIYVFPEYTK